jgi:hypothetical protein
MLLLAAAPGLPDGYRQPVRIDISGDARTKDLLRLLKALDILLDHPPMEGVEVWSAQARAAPPGGRSS